MERINWSTNVSVEGGPTLAVAQSLDVDAYDKFTVAVPAGDDDFAVSLGTVPAGSLHFLLVTGENLAAINPPLTYKVNGAGTEYVLAAPHVYASPGQMVGLGEVTTLNFKNDTGDPATVQVLVGRDATP